MGGVFGSNGAKLSELRPLAWRWRLPAFAVGLLLGEAAAARGGRWPWRIILAAALALPVVLRRRRGARLAATLAGVGACAGLVLGRAGDPPPRSSPEPGAQRVVARISDVRPFAGFGGRSAASMLLEVEGVGEGRGPVRAGDRVRLRAWEVARSWEPGERIGVRIEARPPRGTCNAGRDEVAETAAREGIRWFADAGDDRSMDRLDRVSNPVVAIARARRWIARSIDASVEPRAAPVVRSIVVGDARGLAPDLRDAYARTGTTHVLSVSGLHVAIVARAAASLLRLGLAVPLRLALWCAPARLAAGFALFPAVLYVALAGSAVPAVRSLVSGAALLGAIGLGRRADPWTAIAAGAIWIAATDPAACLGPSFQLSFGAVIAIGAGLRAFERSRLQSWLVAPREAAAPRRLAATLAAALAVSVCAGAGTAPITAFHFGTISAAGVLANLAVVPLVGTGALVIALAGSLVLPVSSDLAAAAFSCAGAIATVADAIVCAIAELPGASVDVLPPSSPEAFGWILLLAAFAVPARSSKRWLRGFGLALLVMGRVASRQPTGTDGIRFGFLDVGQGDATLVEVGGQAWLVDAGGRPSDSRPEASVPLAAIRRRGLPKIDAIAISHPQLDHEGGFEAVIARAQVEAAWWNGSSSESASHATLVASSLERGVPWARVRRGSTVRGAGPEVLGPPAGLRAGSSNDDSLVLRFSRGATSMLLPGDVEAAGERRLLDDGLAGAVLVRAPHHGSRTSSGAAFVDALRPSVVVAGTGLRNRFGLPSPDVRERWKGRGALWLDTAVDGEVVVESDGQVATVETCRSGE